MKDITKSLFIEDESDTNIFLKKKKPTSFRVFVPSPSISVTYTYYSLTYQGYQTGCNFPES